jgi:hypothetical protein
MQNLKSATKKNISSLFGHQLFQWKKLFYVVTTLVSPKDFSVDNFFSLLINVELVMEFSRKKLFCPAILWSSWFQLFTAIKWTEGENLINCGKLSEIHLTIF